MNDAIHPIGFAARASGLSPHVIRAWERRYGALAPSRTQSRRRLYTPGDVERLRILRRAVESGHSIGGIARLDTEALRRLVLDPAGPTAPSESAADRPLPAEEDSHLEDGLRAVRDLDAAGLERVIARASATLGSAALIDRLLLPLMDAVGEEWRRGDARIAHEHMATAEVRTTLGRLLESARVAGSAPLLVTATPTGQNHEMGALAAAVVASLDGWQALYLGPALPAEEIAGAALQAGARALALSLVYPPDDPALPQELAALRRHVGPGLPVLAGGRAAASLIDALRAAGIQYCGTLSDLRSALDELRARNTGLS